MQLAGVPVIKGRYLTPAQRKALKGVEIHTAVHTHTERAVTV